MDFTTKSDIMIFYANAIDSKGEDGSQINGCTVHYLFWGEGGSQLVGNYERDLQKPVGMMRGKSWVSYELRNKICVCPALYEGTFVMQVGSDGKPALKLVDVAYKSQIMMRAYRLRGFEVPGMLELPDDAYPLYGSAADDFINKDTDAKESAGIPENKDTDAKEFAGIPENSGTEEKSNTKQQARK